jgi:hypothetical protein
MWSNRWSTMPVHALPELQLPRPDARARLELMAGTDVPVIRQPFAPGDPLPFWAYAQQLSSICFDRQEDPFEQVDLLGSAAEAELLDLLRHALTAVDAPAEQFERLGIA